MTTVKVDPQKIKAYEEYKQRRSEFYPARPLLSYSQFLRWCDRWDAEYDTAWETKPEPDWSTIHELETALCV